MNTQNKVIFDSDKKVFRFECPSCEVAIEVLHNQINCKIFRCGIFKYNNTSIPPHSSKKSCEEWLEKNMIFGCGKPIQMITKGGIYYVEKCDYI